MSLHGEEDWNLWGDKYTWKTSQEFPMAETHCPKQPITIEWGIRQNLPLCLEQHGETETDKVDL